jgi:hypothetical protein
MPAESWIDVEKSPSHHLSQNEITSDNPCYQHLFGNSPVSGRKRAVLQTGDQIHALVQRDFENSEISGCFELLKGEGPEVDLSRTKMPLIAERLVPNERSIAPGPYTGVSIQSTLSPWAGCSSGALSLHGAVGLAHSPGQNLKGQGAPTKVQ